EYFSKRPEYTIVAFDNRGAGYSGAPYGLYSTSQMAQDALELLDALGWYSDVNVAGISMGGMISLELILAAPKRFSSLVLTSTNAGRSPPQLVTLAFFARVLTILDPQLRLRFITDHLYPKTSLSFLPLLPPHTYTKKTPKNNKTLKKQYIDIPMQPLHANIAQVWAALTHHVSPQRLAQIRASQIPVLIVTGTDDRLVRHSASKYMQKHLDCRMSVFEGSGHIIPSEQTVAYCSLVEELVCESRGGSDPLQSKI
ncbi:MAG: Alpha/Beta hydrolase protein, partial [Linnemannia elongata]